jgi:hypothetical protein
MNGDRHKLQEKGFRAPRSLFGLRAPREPVATDLPALGLSPAQSRSAAQLSFTD